MKIMTANSQFTVCRVLVLAMCAVVQTQAAEICKTFSTPEDAVAALTTEVNSRNRAGLRAIFGATVDELVNPDAVQATNEFATFAAMLAATNRLVRESESRCVLEVGLDRMPFAVPVVRKEGRWLFDTAAGKEELLNRRIGRNELATLNAMRTYVQAQREYACSDRDGDEVLEYAQRFMSTPGAKDGLFWSPDLDGEISPLGPLVAAAAAEGYQEKGMADINKGPQPFHGYLFKILKSQGKLAPGGRYDYVINGNMIGGFALVAWPAEYGNSGIMTFLVNQQGRVYQSDMGSRTAKSAAALQAYDLGAGWSVSPD
jgi:hypothetical protein